MTSFTPLTCRNPLWWIATGLGVGKLPKMPGTWGSLLGLFIGQLLFVAILRHAPTLKFTYHLTIEVWTLFACALVLVCLLLFIVGWWASHVYAQRAGKDDPKEVVIDEVLGQIIVLYGSFPIHLMANIQGDTAQLLVLLWGFCLFRIFDIIKPWPISWVDRRIKGGLGIMLDDMLAAVLALVMFYASMSILMDMHII